MIAAVAAVSAGPAVGPVFAGDAVMSGEEAPNGAVRVMKNDMLVHRVPPATARKTERGFSGMTQVFAGSSERFAAIVSTSTVTFAESDSVSVAVSTGVVSGRFKSPVELLSGSLPRRGDQGCEGRPAYEYPQAVDVDGDRVALGQFADECGPDNSPRDDSVVVVADGVRTTVATGEQGTIRDVALAGRYVAWAREHGLSSEVVVRDFDTGADVVRLTARDLGARGIDEVALQEDGKVAFAYSNRSVQRIAWATPGTPGARVLDRGEFEGLALDGTARRLARFPERRRRVGDLDLDARRATWATRPMRRGYEERPRGPARIVVREL